MSILESFVFAALLILIVSIWGLAAISYRPNILKSDFFPPLVIFIGISVLALIGFVISTCGPYKTSVAYALVFSSTSFAASVLWINRLALRSMAAINPVRPFLLWTGASFIAISITYIEPKQPKELFDGPYVFKTWTLPVKIQALCNDLPPDNAIPAVVTEYLVRDIPFQKERPIMPGQEVANRPILMSLAAVPLRTLLGSSDKYKIPLPRFEYVGQSWPQTLQLTDNGHFRLFLITGIVLNSALIVALYSLLKINSIKYATIASVVFFILSPYALQHSFFTWPKNLAAFFIITSLIIIYYRPLPIWLGGIAMGLAYWSHPYTIIFIISMSLVLLVNLILKKVKLAELVWLYMALFLILVSWPIWTRFGLHMSSDLLQQNFNLKGSLSNQIWTRIYNAQTMLFPNFFNTYPLNISNAIRSYFINLAAPLGLCFIFFTPAALLQREEFTHKMLAIYACISGFLIIMIFSEPAVPLLHGWQAIWPILAVVTMKYIQSLPYRASIIALIIQGTINAIFLTIWINNVRA